VTDSNWNVFAPSALSGRRALVTGAGQGVGERLAVALAAAGASVTVNDIALDRAEKVASQIGGSANAASCDVTDLASVQEMFDAGGPWDIVVNNAGNAGASARLGLTPFAQSDPASWAAPIDVNLRGVMNVTFAALPGMVAQQWGRLITIVSDAGRFGDAGLAAYAGAKAGAAGFVRSIARENGRHGICVNAVALGSISAGDRDPRDAETIAKQVRAYPIRRLGTPEDVAGIVVLLASDASAWITGQTIPVNGGYSSAL
jgi:3-oxoacyl-[acyl-carrier protein] reductase